MKILASDYDGTFNYGGIDETKRAAVKKWQAAGNKFGLVSGRGPELLGSLQKEYSVPLDFLVAFNGALIVNEKNETLYNAVCDTVEIVALLKDLFRWGCGFAHVNSDKYYLVRKKKKSLQSAEYTLKTLPTLSYLSQVSVRLDTVEEAAKTVALIAKKYGDFLTPLQNSVCIDIVPKGVNKAQGLYKLLELYNAEHKDLIAVGDNLNDIDMLRAFNSYAMENGVDEIKNIAAHTTKSVVDLIDQEL